MPKSLQKLKEPKLKLKAPELLVFVRISLLWFILAGCFRVASYAVEKSLPCLSTILVIGLFVCLVVYAFNSDVKSTVGRIWRSYRFDIFAYAIIGAWSNYLTSYWLFKVQKFIDGIDPWWVPTILIALLLMLISSIYRGYSGLKKPPPSQFHFFGDDAIKTENEDTLKNNELAKDFAEMVLASSAHSGLVFGIDAQWGSGKTSFVNLAEHYWKEAEIFRVVVASTVKS